MTLKLTQKMFKLLKEKPESLTITTENSIFNWYVNLIYLNRKKCILFTSEKTLYSFLIYNFSLKDKMHFKEIFLSHLKLNLEFEGIEVQKIESYINLSKNIFFTKTSNRQVLGSMNDIVNCLEVYNYYDNYNLLDIKDLVLLNQKVNTNILSMIDYKYPIDLMKKELLLTK